MDLTSERVLFGAAGAGGIQSYAQTLQGYQVIYDGTYVDFDPVTERTAFAYYQQSSLNPVIVVWDKDWNRLFNSAYYNAGLSTWGFLSCKFDTSGNLFITGTSTQTNYNTPLLKLDTSYNLTLNNGGYYSTTSYAWSLDKDATGLYIAQSISVDGALILTKTNLTGTSISWSKQLTNSFNRGYPPRKVLAKGGSVYTFGEGNRSSSSGQTGFVAKWDTSGSVLWARYIGGSNSVFSGGDVDSSGNVYCAGYANYVPYVVKFNSSGTQQWYLTSTQYQYFTDVVVDDATGDIYIAGQLDNVHFWLIKANSSGTVQWQRRFVMYNVSNSSSTSMGFSRIRCAFQPNGAVRLYGQGYDSIHGFRLSTVIEYDPVSAPTGTYPDSYSYGGYVTYRWEVTNPAISITYSTGTVAYADTVSVTNAGNTLRALPSHSISDPNLSPYSQTIFT